MKNAINSWQFNSSSHYRNLAFFAILILSCTACASTKSNVITQEQTGNLGKTEPLIAVKIYSPDEPNAPIPDEAPSMAPPSLSQQRAEALADTTIFTRLEVEPSFNYNGKSAATYISEEIAKAKTADTIKEKGIVKLRFVVERNGSITNPIILQSGSETLAMNSLAILTQMPNWRPGSLNGWEHRAYVTLVFNW